MNTNLDEAITHLRRATRELPPGAAMRRLLICTLYERYRLTGNAADIIDVDLLHAYDRTPQAISVPHSAVRGVPIRRAARSAHMTPFITAASEPHTSTALVAVVPLSPRLGVSFAACELASQLLVEHGATVKFCTTVDLPLVAAGMGDVPGYSYPKAVLDFVAEIEQADALVFGAPVHESAVAGVARNWIEILASSIAGKPVLPLVAAGSERSHLAAVQFRADLFSNFGLRPVKPVVVTGETPKAEVFERVEAGITELLADYTPAVAPLRAAS